MINFIENVEHSGSSNNKGRKFEKADINDTNKALAIEKQFREAEVQQHLSKIEHLSNEITELRNKYLQNIESGKDEEAKEIRLQIEALSWTIIDIQKKLIQCEDRIKEIIEITQKPD